MNIGKRVPNYWWDFRHRENCAMDIVVESDDDRFPIVGIVYEIEEAEALISDLNAGRADPRKLAASLRIGE